MKFFISVVLFLFCSVRGQLEGGTYATQGQFPYMVQVGVLSNGRPQVVCGGVIIRLNWVLTAGHCVITLGGLRQHVYIVAGDIKRRGNHQDRRLVHANRVFPHRQLLVNEDGFWDAARNINGKYDIALVYFNQEIPVNPSINVFPASVTEEGNCNFIRPRDHGTKCRVMGWGNTISEMGDLEGGSVPSQILKYGRVKTIDEESEQFSPNHHIVVGDGRNRKRGNRRLPLKGDSGGPLVCRNERKEERLCGIGVKGQTRVYEVFMRLETFGEWMRTTIREAEEDDDEDDEDDEEDDDEEEEEARWQNIKIFLGGLIGLSGVAWYLF